MFMQANVEQSTLSPSDQRTSPHSLRSLIGKTINLIRLKTYVFTVISTDYQFPQCKWPRFPNCSCQWRRNISLACRGNHLMTANFHWIHLRCVTSLPRQRSSQVSLQSVNPHQVRCAAYLLRPSFYFCMQQFSCIQHGADRKLSAEMTNNIRVLFEIKHYVDTSTQI